MKKLNILMTAVALVATAVCAYAAETIEQADAPKESKKKKNSEIVDHLKSHYKFYGFIRNYMPFDTRDSYAGSGDLYYWVPKDNNWNTADENDPNRQDLNEKSAFRMLAITSRLGVDVSGYWIGDNEFGGKVEADFFAGLTGSTGTAQLRLRQAYMTVKWTNPDAPEYTIGFKAGQAWHPIAADLPDILALDSGMPFGPFSRTPQMTADFNLGRNFTITASAIWQMQYCSAGLPTEEKNEAGKITKVTANSSADYIKYSKTPEFYLGLSYQTGGFLGRVGVDVTSICPVSTRKIDGVTMKVKDRETSVLGFMYLQYTKNLFKFKAKTVYGGSGEHVNLESGYAVYDKSDPYNWKYTPIRTSDTWVTLSYGQKVQGSVLLGYMKNFGTSKDILANAAGTGDASCIAFQKNGAASINQMYRIEPLVAYNVGRFTVGLEYMLTAVQYGDQDANNPYLYTYTLRALPYGGMHWVMNHRIEGMVRFTF